MDQSVNHAPPSQCRPDFFFYIQFYTQSLSVWDEVILGWLLRATESLCWGDVGCDMNEWLIWKCFHLTHKGYLSHGCQMAIAKCLDCRRSAWKTMAPLRCAAKFDPFLSLDCAPTPSTLAQSKERKGSNFAIWQHWLCPLCNFFRWNHMAWDDERLKRDSPRHILQLHRKGCKFHYEVVTRKKTGWWGRPQQTLSPCKSLY